jgi:hypothetical protein
MQIIPQFCISRKNQPMTRGILLALLFFTHFTHLSFAQSDVPRSWHLLDYDQDSFYGISLNKAYQFLSTKNKTAQPIIVAVLDSGVDTTHEDLKKILELLSQVPTKMDFMDLNGRGREGISSPV